ncbi:hypothetical protein H072_2450 [Dactylellina haptotyla CBS 200.50]|uniref:Actin-like ATPase domain-containing protein n=1 Tax=Dactylellina haptotyla (strain CBS 200.50) TaxID=1284197 RepID=S8AL27_DACHA|nr:hypothetical protein H072_2450 [Dactylellina haptotyla CBS 200.50]
METTGIERLFSALETEEKDRLLAAWEIVGAERPAVIAETTERGGPIVENMERELLIVAVDFGTTYSGVAFCLSSQKDLNDIEVITSWAGHGNGIAPKIPTEIRYINGRPPLWGAEASINYERRRSNSANVYSRFKLLLDLRAGNDWYGCGSVFSTDEPPSESISLPPGKSAVRVSTDFLRLVYEELMNNILRKRFPDTLDFTPIQFVFTVPAIWDHRAQEATRTAATKAGFSTRSFDTLSLVSEPEAAAMFVIKAMHEKSFTRMSTPGPSSLKDHETFVICDAGGGTVDLISYQVMQLEPGLKLKEAAVGTGAKCGSSYIDEGFLRLLRKKIGPEFDDERVWRKKYINPSSPLMREFDRIKKSFGQTGQRAWYLDLPVEVEDDEDEGIFDNELMFTVEDLKILFDPVVDKIIQLVDGQVEAVSRNSATVSKVFLVGGFGESQYLYDRMVRWARERSPPLVVVNPSKSWSAMMRGAVAHSLQPVVEARKLRQHYGFSSDPKFEPSLHDVSRAYFCPFSQKTFASDGVKWTALMDDDIEENEEVKFSIYRSRTEQELLTPEPLRLFGSMSIDPPNTSSHKRVYSIGMVPIDLSGLDIGNLPSLQVIESGIQTIKFKLDLDVVMNIGSAEAIFSVWHNSECMGKSRISYDS